MSAVGIEWYACRVNPQFSRRPVYEGAEYVPIRGSKGRRLRRVVGTGKPVPPDEALLRRAGFRVFRPVRKDWRIKNAYAKKKTLVPVAVMPGWLFIGWEEGAARWHEPREMGIVTSYGAVDGAPLRIGMGDMVRLMEIYGGKDVAPADLRYMRRGCEYAVGDTCRVDVGPFEGVSVRVEEIAGATVKVLMDALGGAVRASLATGSLSPC